MELWDAQNVRYSDLNYMALTESVIGRTIIISRLLHGVREEICKQLRDLGLGADAGVIIRTLNAWMKHKATRKPKIFAGRLRNTGTIETELTLLRSQIDKKRQETSIRIAEGVPRRSPLKTSDLASMFTPCSYKKQPMVDRIAAPTGESKNQRRKRLKALVNFPKKKKKLFLDGPTEILTCFGQVSRKISVYVVKYCNSIFTFREKSIFTPP